jgi:hypothetical protein
MASIISAGTTSGTSLNLSGDTSGVLQLASNGSTTAVTINTSQNVGIGTASPSDRLVISGVASVYGDERRLVQLVDTTAIAAGVGAGISFYGVSESGGGTSQFGSIKGIKENATASNYAGALAFVTSTSANSQNERMRIASDGTISTTIGSTLYGAYPARAWVNFNGTGTVAIRQSRNVSSITDNGTGDYTVNFTQAMPDTEYSAGGGCGNDNSDDRIISPLFFNQAPTTSGFRLRTTNNSGSPQDVSRITVSVFR